MKILVACEESQTVCKAFRERGHEAYSADIPPRKVFDSGKSMPAWYADAWTLPKEERAKLRSKTFPGIAEAMAGQWGMLA